MLTNLPRDRTATIPSADLVSEYVQKSRIDEMMYVRTRVDDVLTDLRFDMKLDKRTYDNLQERLDDMFAERYQMILEGKYGTDNNS